MRTRKVLRCLVACLSIAAGAAAVRALPWTQDMVRGRAVEPQTLMQVPPPNTLAINHPRVMDRTEADGRLTNPRAASPEILRQGRTLFDMDCAVCHGADGRNPGAVGKNFRMVPDLSEPAIQAYSDGLIYSIIREGGFEMPGYADALSPAERWALVHFVRTFRQPS